MNKELRVPPAAAWEILTSRVGAQRWLGDEHHGPIEVGATFPVRGVGIGTVVGVLIGSRIDVAFPDGTEATLAFAGKRDICELTVAHSNLAAVGWAQLVELASLLTRRASDERSPRQAIVVIHGIGNQRPLATARRFTDAIVDRKDRWSKPDKLSSSYELRRYQLKRSKDRPRTDVYELYWADKVSGTTMAHIVAWLRGQVRSPADVSPALRPVLYLTVALTVLLLFALLWLVVEIGTDGVGELSRQITSVAGLSLVTGAVTTLLVKTVGDAARYLDDDPENIAVRQSIRESGITLLRRLHNDARYDRVVLVGHSLGSVIAYDLIRLYWVEVHREHASPSRPDQELMRRYTPGATDQKDLWEENRTVAGNPWLITDFVSVGSPLTHARSLLARSTEDLELRQQELELPTCPPRAAGSLTFTQDYVVDGQRNSVRVLSHGCPFAVTRWTNLYAPVRAGFFGDLVGGPVAPAFGTGVKDVPVRMTSVWRRCTLIAHTSYWCRDDAALKPLLLAIDLDSAKWLDRYVGALPWSRTLR